MGIEEDNTAKAIADNIEWIDHVHLVDSNRKLPGQGEKDFAPALAALKNGGFDGYLCMECGVPGDDPAAQFKKSVKCMRDAIGRIG
ncbi:MAG TPA: TIM barrel protein, partial [bacterium]|nr:TIM barrel protein [bacterium]